MDPDAALAELLDLARAHQAELDDESTNNHADTGQMADLVLGLHDWLSTGGFLPAAWAVGRATDSSPEHRPGGPEGPARQKGAPSWRRPYLPANCKPATCTG